VPDNLKAGVTDPCRYEPGIIELRSAKGVRSYQEFAEHYGKGLQRLNSRVMHGYGLSRQGLFEQVDQPALQPLPALPFVFGHWKSAKVNVDYHIEVEHHYYSVPYTLVTQEVQVKVSEQLVEIFHQHQRMACHARSRLRYRHTSIPEHMPPEHLAYKQQSKERFLAWAEPIGVQTTAQVQAIFASKAHEEQAFRSLKGLQRLSQRYHPDRVESACRRANAFGLVGVRRLRTILENQLDQVPLPETVPPSPVTQHPNVRGSQYYH